MKVHNLLVTGSLTSGGENITAISSSVSSTVTSLSSSVSTSIGQLSSSMVSSMTSLSSSLTSSMGGLSSSMASSMTSLSSSLTGSMGSLSSSMVTSMNSLSSSMGSIMATTGSNLFKGDQTISGSIIPSVNNTYDLGSPTQQFRHVYISSGSLYVNGTKVLGSTAQELQITTDAGQSFKILEAGSDTITLQAADGNITLAASGGGDVILDPTTGIIALKGTTTVYAGNKILSSDGNAIQFGNSVTMTGSLVVTGYIETQELRTTYISSSILYRSGSTKFGDDLLDTHAFTGSLSVSGSISVPGSGLVSGSSQISYAGLSNVPSGIISGSVQVISALPAGTVSGSSQVLNGTTIHSGSFFNGISVVSGSGQISYTGITNIPSGIVSGSSQVTSLLPSGIVSGSSQVLAGTTIHSGSFFNGISVISGSAQIDVLSTTNIARIATTGSNTFTGIQNIGSSLSPTSGGDIITVFGSGSASDIKVFTTTNHATFFEANTNSGSIVTRLQSQNASFVGTLTNNTFDIVAGGNVIIRTTGSGLVGINKSTTPNATLDVNGNTLVTGSFTSTSTIQSNGGSIQTYNQTSGYGVGFYFPGSTTPSIFADNVLRIYQRVEVWGGTGGYYLDVRNSSGTQNIKFDGNGGNSFLNSGNFNIGYSSDQGAKLYVQANQASYAAYFEQVGGATSSYGGVRITTNSTGVNSLYIDNAGTQIFSVKGSGVAYVQNALGVGYSDPQYTLQVNGSIGLRANSQNIKAITGTGWGYSVSSYKVVMLGDTANNVTVSIGYDPSGNSNSAFTGDGREVLFRNGASFATPNAANTSFNLNTLVMKDGKVAVGTADPTGKLHVYSTSASDTYLETGTSGTSGKLIFKTSDNSDLNKYIAQESYYMMFSSNSNEGFKWRDSNSNVLMTLYGSTNAYANRLGINTTTPAHALDVTGNMRINQSVAYLYFTSTTTNRYLAYNGADTYWRADGVHYFEKTSGYKGSWDASGNLTVTGTITESSALRYKDKIETLENALDKILRLRGVSYIKKETGIKEFGLIAEETNEVAPELVLKNAEGEIESVAYGRINSLLIEAVKELKKEIEELKLNR